MNSNPTSYVQTVDSTMLFIIAISALFLIGIVVVMVYFVFKYNRKKGVEPVDIHGSLILEIIWFIIPAILVMAMFYYGFIGYKELKEVPDNALEINVTGKMWDWDFIYDNGQNLDTLIVPVNTPIKLNLKSVDVNHSFFIPAFRIKQDVIGGKTNILVFTPIQTGDFDVACAEYCGLNHSAMYTKVRVIPKEDYERWYKANSNNEGKD